MKLNLPDELLESIGLAIQGDNTERLVDLLKKTEQYGKEDGEPLQRLLLNYFQLAIAKRARKCITVLLGRLKSLDEPDDINKRNIFHRFIIGIGKSRSNKANVPIDGTSPEIEAVNTIAPAEAPILELPAYAMQEIDASRMLNGGDDAAAFMRFLVGELQGPHRAAIKTQDAFGRMPLHYAAKYGFIDVCALLMEKLQEWKLLDLTDGVDATQLQDAEENTPLALAVIGGWRMTVETLLQASNFTPSTAWHKASRLLASATKANFSNIVRSLVEAGANANYQDEQGETALHIAARFGREDCAAALVRCATNVDLEIKESTYGWTPLMLASVDGHLSMVDLLITAGAEVDSVDNSGWSSMEHAALRGNMDIAELLSKHATPQALKPHDPSLLSTSLGNSIERTKTAEDSCNSGIGKEGSPHKNDRPVRSFGHRYLTNESMVLISLGSMDARKIFKPVDLDNIPYAEAHATQLDTALSIVVSAQGATGEPTIIDLPVQETISTEPIVFTTKDVSKVKILFDIVPTYSPHSDRPVARGVALLTSVKPTLAHKKMSLQGDLSVPVVSAKTLDFIGTVNFNFSVVTPFTHPNMSISESKMYWKRVSGPMVIGHRGMGKNMTVKKSLQLGENTMQSFITAANLGASYVEFDVQLTKDHVPVIYHDFLVSETGLDAPVHTLTLDQFLHVNESASSRVGTPGIPHRKDPFNVSTTPQMLRSRANSLGTDTQTSNTSERMKHTRDFKAKGFKPNTRGAFIQAPFTTLEEMLRKLPMDIGFNIEMKYPMLFETELEEMDAMAVELNQFVDTVLKMVYDLGGARNVIFSSFHPDICLLLSLKQPSFPVLFLTDAGTSKVGDVRASSLQEAIRFATRWSLLGVVSAAEPLVLCPRLVRVVKESGLVCVSYGTLNNDSGNVKLQVDQGIDAVIVDSVLAIRKGLTEGAAKAATKESEMTKENEVKQSVVNGGGVSP